MLKCGASGQVAITARQQIISPIPPEFNLPLPIPAAELICERRLRYGLAWQVDDLTHVRKHPKLSAIPVCQQVIAGRWRQRALVADKAARVGESGILQR